MADILYGFCSTIVNSVVELGDGTYGVKLGAYFYRVDADLPVAGVNDATPSKAKLGNENSMWVAIVEKAYAHYRTGANSYASLNSGWSVDVNRAFRSSTAGEKALTTYTSATALANDVYNRWSTKQSVTIGFTQVKTGSTGNAPLVMKHMYTVWSVTKNSAGQVTNIVLRNPWGIDGSGNDGKPYDGLVTVTPAQLMAYTGAVNWGAVQ